jgi:threonyl-tRNA synthetase
MLIVGENEKERGEVSVRRHTEGDLGSQTIETFQEKIRQEIEQ